MSDIGILYALDGARAATIHRCLGAMSGIVVLSRIHPFGLQINNPLEQADRWFGLISDEDRDRLMSQQDWPYQDILELISDRATAAGKRLVVGDWSNVDFVGGVPLDQLAGVFVHAGVLELKFEVKAAALVRHPIDQWLEIRDRGAGDAAALHHFLRGYHKFVQCLHGIPTVKYEHFETHPEAVLREICDAVGAPYDAGWQSRWQDFTDVAPEVAADLTRTEIAATPRPDLDADLLQSFELDPNYAPAIQLLGYEHPTR